MDLIYMILSGIANFIINGIAYILDILANAILHEFTPVMNKGSLDELFTFSNMGVSDRMNEVFPFMRPANHIFIYIAFAMIAILFAFNIIRQMTPAIKRGEGVITQIVRFFLAIILTALSYSLINVAMNAGYQMILYTQSWSYVEWWQGDKNDYKIDEETGRVIAINGNPVYYYGEDEYEDDKDAEEILNDYFAKHPEKIDELNQNEQVKDNIQANMDIETTDGNITVEQAVAYFSDKPDEISKYFADGDADSAEVRKLDLHHAAELEYYDEESSGKRINPQHLGTGVATVLDNSIAAESFSGAAGAVLAKTVLIPVLLMIAILWNFCKLFMEVAERLIVTTFITSLAPLGFCSVVCKETEGIFYKYLQMVFSTYLVFVIDIWFIRAFIYSVGNTAVVLNLMDLVWNMFLWLALLITAQKADQHLREAGLSVSQTGGNLLGEMMIAGRTLSRAGQSGMLSGIAGTKFGNMIGAKTVAPATRQTGAKDVGRGLQHFMGKDASNELMNELGLAPTNGSHFIESKFNSQGKADGFKSKLEFAKSGNAVEMESFKNAKAAQEAGMTPFYFHGQTYGLKGTDEDVAAIIGAAGGGANVVDDATLKDMNAGFEDAVNEFSNNPEAFADAAETAATADAIETMDDDFDQQYAAGAPEAKAESSVDMAKQKQKEAAEGRAEAEAKAETASSGRRPISGEDRTRMAINQKANAVAEATTAGMNETAKSKAISGAVTVMAQSGMESDYKGCANYRKSTDPAYVTRTKALDNTGRGVEFQTVPAQYAHLNPDICEGRTPCSKWKDEKGREFYTYKSQPINTSKNIELSQMNGEQMFAGKLQKTSTPGIYAFKTPDEYDDDPKKGVVKKGKNMLLVDQNYFVIPKNAVQATREDGSIAYIMDVDRASGLRRR